jgi:DnaK suppressor protein
MDEALRERIRTALDNEIRNVRDQLESLKERAGTVQLDQPIGRLSRMDSLTNQGIVMNAMNKARPRLGRLESALERIDEPEFGICLECGEPIADDCWHSLRPFCASIAPISILIHCQGLRRRTD